MYRVDCYQSDMAVNAGPCVPARGWLVAVVHSDGQAVGLAGRFKVGSEVVPEGCITVGAFAQVLTIDPNLTVGHHTVKFNKGVFAIEGAW